jgi:hypothetical protein
MGVSPHLQLGTLDLEESGTAREAWRSMRDNRGRALLRLPAQELTQARGRPRADRGRSVRDSDYSAPGNRSTAITSLKSRRNGDYRAMRERSRAFMAELLAGAATAARVETKTATAADLRIHDITFSPCRGTLNSPRRGGEPARLVLPRARRDFPPDKGARVSRLGPGVRSSEESGEN